MKSMKLASGFAVSALALAIAGQATAETETEVTFTGAVEVQAWFNFDNEDRDLPNIGFAGEDSGDLDNPNNAVDGDLQATLNANVNVVHGPFSGDLTIGGDIEGADVGVENLKVEEGPIAFGQLDSIIGTDGLLDTVTDGDNDGLSYGDPRAAFRYSADEFGLKVQLEGDSDGADPATNAGDDDFADFGISVAFTQDLDIAQVWVDASHREQGAGANVSDKTFYGVGAEVTPVDTVTLTAAFQGETSDETSAYGLKADVNLTDTIMVFGQFYDPTVEADDSEMVKVGYSVGFEPITVEGNYKAGLADVAEGTLYTKLTYSEGVITAWVSHEIGLADGDGQTVKTKVEYSDSPWAAYAGTDLALPDEGDTGITITLGGNYTTESSIEYGAQYKRENDAAGGANLGRLYASYNF